MKYVFHPKSQSWTVQVSAQASCAVSALDNKALNKAAGEVTPRAVALEGAVVKGVFVVERPAVPKVAPVVTVPVVKAPTPVSGVVADHEEE